MIRIAHAGFHMLIQSDAGTEPVYAGVFVKGEYRSTHS